jgi:acetamidase/formamidase
LPSVSYSRERTNYLPRVSSTILQENAQGIRGPRLESATHIMAIGLGGSLEDALREATGSMAAWLNDEYKLTPSEVAQVLGCSAE